MKEIVDWLRGMEQLASDLYKSAASFFEEDKSLSEFLVKLGDDEAHHGELMEQASEYMRQSGIHVKSDIILDQETKDRLEKPLKEHYNLLQARTLSKKQLIDLIAETEFSEWNDIFLFVIDSMKKYAREFEHLAATIQDHEKRIEHFIDKLPDELKLGKDIHELTTIWQNKFLIVEDEKSILNILARILAKKGIVETAENGQEGLEKIREHFFNVIISDIDMPIMDGLEFYAKAVEEDEDVKTRFLFCSGNITPTMNRFLVENNLFFLTKPITLDEFIRAVEYLTDKVSQL